MPNKNYLAGRRWEYKIMEMLRTSGWTVMRTAQSRGPFDIIAISNTPPHPVRMTQCKVVSTEAAADRLLRGFVKHPPFDAKLCVFEQFMEIWIKGTKRHVWEGLWESTQ